MKALISTIEPVEFFDYDNKKTVNGFRVAQVESDDKIFAVSSDLFWIDCADDVIADRFYYEPNTKQIISVPLPPPPKPKSDQPSNTGTVTI